MHSSRSDREAFWQNTLAHWKRSGLSISAYCRQHTLAHSSFHRWKTKLTHTSVSERTNTFMPVTLVAETLVEIALTSGLVVKLPLASDPALVAQLVKAVKSC